MDGLRLIGGRLSFFLLLALCLGTGETDRSLRLFLVWVSREPKSDADAFSELLFASGVVGVSLASGSLEGKLAER